MLWLIQFLQEPKFLIKKNIFIKFSLKLHVLFHFSSLHFSDVLKTVRYNWVLIVITGKIHHKKNPNQPSNYFVRYNRVFVITEFDCITKYLIV